MGRHDPAHRADDCRERDGARAGTQRLDVKASPSAQAPAGAYPINVAVTAGEQQATAQLGVEITGTVEMQLTTPDELLNTTANAGATHDFAVVVVNSGTSPLAGIALTGTGPDRLGDHLRPGHGPGHPGRQVGAGDGAHHPVEPTRLPATTRSA